MDLIRRARRQGEDELLLHPAGNPARTVELEPVLHRRSSGRGQADNPTDEGGGHHHEAVRPVDVVLDHLVVEHDDPDQPRLHAEARHHLRSAEAGLFGLRAGIEPERYHLADVHADQLGRARGHRDFVGSSRIGQPALDGRQTVLDGQFAVDAAHRRHVIYGADHWSAV